MPRYFFHQRLSVGIIPDKVGSDLPDLSAAVAEAIESARELMSEAIREGQDISARCFEVTDQSQKTLLVLPFREACTPAD
jgi:ferric iron reductase protein FhuF